MARVTYAAIVNSSKEIVSKGNFSSFLNDIGGDAVENLFNIVHGTDHD